MPEVRLSLEWGKIDDLPLILLADIFADQTVQLSGRESGGNKYFRRMNKDG